MTPLSLPAFIARWQRSTLSERSAAQSHFIDLCRLLGEPAPAEADPEGEFYSFEKGLRKSTGGDGFADVWKRGFFAWEYKGKHKSLVEAYRQLQLYQADLDYPPLLVTCDFDQFEIHTAFNNSARQSYRFRLADLADPAPLLGARYSALDTLRYLFTDPEKLRPEYTPSQVTERAAREFAALAESLRRYGADPEKAARFLVRLLFCLFAQDVGLLPNHLFTQLVENYRHRGVQFSARLRELFKAMVAGGSFGVEEVPAFDGGLFADDETLELASDDMELLARACRMDWASIEPAILGTLQLLDPACGSGNFLYVALKQLLDLEKRAITLAASLGIESWFPRVSPDQLHGVELNPYAHELAQASIWIGYLQWLRDNGFEFHQTPILRPLDNVLQMDAVLGRDAGGRPVEPEWPQAGVIVGNPPFLGGKRLRAVLGDGYVDDLFSLYDGRVPREADLVCYWFEKARALVAAGRVKRAGLLATQAIRGGANRRMLERIKETGDIFMAWSDRPWVQEGVAVHVSMAG